MTRKQGRPEKYPFDEWFDGEVHILQPGVHWVDGMALKVFRITVNQAARRKRLIVRTEQTADGNLKVWKVGDDDDCLLQSPVQPNSIDIEVPLVELSERRDPHGTL